MRILGIESSCDETSVAVVDCAPDGHKVINLHTNSQIMTHQEYGGVVPEVAGRKHCLNIVPTIKAAIDDLNDIDLIAVTRGPGLAQGLTVGVSATKSLALAWDIPLIGVNHMEGHLLSQLLSDEIRPSDFEFPAISLTVSGGHTDLVLVKDFGQYELIGRTKDDAAGEAFDKIAKMLGLTYPGGPSLSKAAIGGDSAAIDFPRAMRQYKNFDFSFSGLKTSVLYYIKDNPDYNLADVAASAQEAIVDILAFKTINSCNALDVKTLFLNGGVAANEELRQRLTDKCLEHEVTFIPCDKKYTGDNGAMIAMAGIHRRGFPHSEISGSKSV